MGVFIFDNESTFFIDPAKLYKALVTDADNIISKAVENIQCVEAVEGNGGPGSIKKMMLGKYVLDKIEVIDEASWGYRYSIDGGAGLPDIVDKLSFETKLVEGPNGESIGKITIKLQTKGDAQPNEEEAKAGKARSDAFFKAIESYISANPFTTKLNSIPE